MIFYLNYIFIKAIRLFLVGKTSGNRCRVFAMYVPGPQRYLTPIYIYIYLLFFFDALIIKEKTSIKVDGTYNTSLFLFVKNYFKKNRLVNFKKIDLTQKKLDKKFKVIGAVTQLGILGCDTNQWNDKVISKNPFFCPDKKSVKLWEKYLLAVRKAGSSCGAVIELRA